MHEEALLPGRPLLLKCGSKTVLASVTEIKHRIDTDSFQKLAAKQLELNEIAIVNIATREPLAFDPYAANRTTGGFILIDRMTNQTVGAGMIDFALRRARRMSAGRRLPSTSSVGWGRRAIGPPSLVHRPLRRGQVDGREHG